MDKWEYLAVTYLFIYFTYKISAGPRTGEFSSEIGLLKTLGDEGWELVNIVASTKNGTTDGLVYYFKRPKQD